MEKLPEERVIDIFEVWLLEGEAGEQEEDASSHVYVLSVHQFSCLKFIYALAPNYYLFLTCSVLSLSESPCHCCPCVCLSTLEEAEVMNQIISQGSC